MTKTVGHATPVLSSATPNARMAVSCGSERSGNVRPSFVASSAEVFGSSTEIAASEAPLPANSPSLLCSSPSCVRQ